MFHEAVDAMEDMDTLYVEAAERGDIVSVAKLLHAGVDVNITDDNHCSALMVTTDPTTAEYLIEAGANVHAPQYLTHLTPLMFAAMSGNPEVIRVLLKGGAWLEDRSRTGCTALTLAAKQGLGDAGDKLARVQCLLAAGADPLTKDNVGHSPRYWARRGGLTRTAEVLAGAERGRRHVSPNGLRAACCDAIICLTPSHLTPHLPLPPSLLKLLQDTEPYLTSKVDAPYAAM